MAIWAWGARRAALWGAKKGWEKWRDRKHQEVNVGVRTESTHKYMPFRAQRAIAAFFVFGALASLSVGVIWNHVDNITALSPNYKILAKFGLGVVELIALFILCWELTAKDKVLSMTCYVAEFILVVVMVVHAAAVLQLDASGSQQEKTVNITADALAKVEAARTTARIAAAGDAAPSSAHSTKASAWIA